VRAIAVWISFRVEQTWIYSLKTSLYLKIGRVGVKCRERLVSTCTQNMKGSILLLTNICVSEALLDNIMKRDFFLIRFSEILNSEILFSPIAHGTKLSLQKFGYSRYTFERISVLNCIKSNHIWRSTKTLVIQILIPGDYPHSFYVRFLFQLFV
jgi:hypothetical protein